MPELDLTTAEKLMILRRRKGWSRAQLASKLKIKTRRLRSWEENTRKPNPTATLKIERFLAKQVKKQTGAMIPAPDGEPI